MQSLGAFRAWAYTPRAKRDHERALLKKGARGGVFVGRNTSCIGRCGATSSTCFDVMLQWGVKMIRSRLMSKSARRYGFAVLFLMSMSGWLEAVDRVLVVTATAGFRHDSIPTAEGVIAGIAARTRWFEPVYARTEEEAAAALAPERLREMRAVMFVNTTGEIAVAGRPHLLQWIEEGGSFMGVHSASDTWHESPEFIALVGGEFDTHPDQRMATVFVEDTQHTATAPLDSPKQLFEEYYLFRNFDPARVRLLLALHANPENDSPGLFPLAWTRQQGSGRVFYTALGHRIDVWTSDWFQQHLTGAIAWSLRRDELPRRRPAKR